MSSRRPTGLPRSASSRWRRSRHSTSSAARRLLNRLIDERLRAPGRPVGRDTLVAAGWPGERILEDAAAHRVRVGVYELRQLGVDGIETVGDGYRLVSDVRFGGPGPAGLKQLSLRSARLRLTR